MPPIIPYFERITVGFEQKKQVAPFSRLIIQIIWRSWRCALEAKEVRSNAATEAHVASIADPSEYPETTITRKLMRTLIEITDHKFDDAARTLLQGIALVQKWPHAVMVGSARVRRERRTTFSRSRGT